jgi:hypothetical protein
MRRAALAAGIASMKKRLADTGRMIDQWLGSPGWILFLVHIGNVYNMDKQKPLFHGHNSN